MFSSDELQFGLLPERKVNWRSLATSYGLEVLFILLLVTASAFWPSQIQFRQRHTVMDLVPPPPELTPAPLKLKTSHTSWPTLPLHPSRRLSSWFLRNFVPLPKKWPKLPKVVMNTFKPVVLEQSGARKAKLLYTGSFGSTPAPTVNAAVEKGRLADLEIPRAFRDKVKQTPICR